MKRRYSCMAHPQAAIYLLNNGIEFEARSIDMGNMELCFDANDEQIEYLKIETHVKVFDWEEK